jgi:hypothetical protein
VDDNLTRAERIAKAFHDRYEQFAPHLGYETREASAVPWDDVPAENKTLMVAVVLSLLGDRTISVPPSPSTDVPAARLPRPRSSEKTWQVSGNLVCQVLGILRLSWRAD